MQAHFGAVFLAVAVVCGVYNLPAHARDARIQSITAARRAAIGSNVTVRGTVTVPNGAFDAGFAVQQGRAGIYVLDALGETRSIGDSVIISGTLVDNSGLLAIKPSAIHCEQHARPIAARDSSTGEVGEATEGRLLQLEGAMVGELIDDSPYGYKFMIDDGSGPIQIFLYPGANVPTTGLVAGAQVSVVCFSSQYETHYECDPPNPASLQVEP